MNLSEQSSLWRESEDDPGASPPSLSKVAYCRIKRRILELELRPGSSLTEITLMNAEGMSRTPIRQALQLLEQEGFVFLAPGKGWFIKDISLRDLQEIFVVREALEGMAARLAAESISDESLSELSVYMEKIRKNGECSRLEADPGDIIHQKIIDAIDNKQMRRAISLNGDHLRRFHLMSIRLPGRSLQSYEEHLEILRALSERHGEKSEAAMRTHIRSSKQSLFDAIASGKVAW